MVERNERAATDPDRLAILLVCADIRDRCCRPPFRIITLMDSDSHPSISDADKEFLAAFEAGQIANQDFHHRDHLRLAWVQIRRLGLERTSASLTLAIRP